MVEVKESKCIIAVSGLLEQKLEEFGEGNWVQGFNFSFLGCNKLTWSGKSRRSLQSNLL